MKKHAGVFDLIDDRIPLCVPHKVLKNYLVDRCRPETDFPISFFSQDETSLAVCGVDIPSAPVSGKWDRLYKIFLIKTNHSPWNFN